MAQGLLRSNKTRDGIAAVLAENIAYMEEDIYDVQQEWEEQKETFSGMEDALEQAGLRVLNKPNLINTGKSFWTTREMPTSTVVAHTYTIPIEDATAAAATLTYTITDAAITSSYKIFQKTSSDYTNVPTTLVTATFAAGSATVTIAARSAHSAAVTIKLWLCTSANATVPYGSAARISGTSYPYLKSIQQGDYPGDDTTDDVACSVVTLTGNDIITELDGVTYDHALQFNITANTAYANTEWLLSGAPYFYTKYGSGQIVKDYGQVSEMTPGQMYTVMFFARVISGDGAVARFGYGGSYVNAPTNDATNHRSGISDWIDISGSDWTRYSWTFQYNPTGDWYTEAADANDNTKTIRSYNYYKKVAFGIGRKHTAVVQLAGFRLVQGRLWICETYDDLSDALEETQNRATAAETAIESIQTAVQAAICETDSATATANHAVGDVFWMNGVLYKATAAIATGETITPGTNCETTTVEAMIAAAVAGVDLSSKADKADTVLTSTLSRGRKANSTVGICSFAFGTDVIASGTTSHAEGFWTQATGLYSHAEGSMACATGKISHAQGQGTIANHANQHACGSYNVADDSSADEASRGNYIEIVGNGTSGTARSNARTLDWSGNEALAGSLTLGKGTADEVTITAAQLKQLLALLS